MALDFVAMRTEFFARGFSYLNDSGGANTTRAKRWLNDAMHDIDEMDAWPYLESSTTGTAPVSVSDLGRVESVIDVANLNTLRPADRATLSDYYSDLTLTGQAEFFYVTGGTAVAVFPVSTATFTIRYWKYAADLSADADTPSMPDRFRMAIVEFACAKAYLDSDNPEMAGVCRQEGERIVQQMREYYAQQGGDGEIVVTGSGSDW